MDSRWVRGEARDAADRGVLVPVRFENAKLPIDFRALHTTDLDDWGGDAKGRRLPQSLQGARGQAWRSARPRVRQSAAQETRRSASACCPSPT